MEVSILVCYLRGSEGVEHPKAPPGQGRNNITTAL